MFGKGTEFLAIRLSAPRSKTLNDVFSAVCLPHDWFSLHHGALAGSVAFHQPALWQSVLRGHLIRVMGQHLQRMTGRILQGTIAAFPCPVSRHFVHFRQDWERADQGALQLEAPWSFRMFLVTASRTSSAGRNL